ncbi:bifunctional folylpolyglutamate synthase/dihydrofolate synthase [Novosphingobium flavum]|uniref:bifunctional folylpolyglutamate synthase/dihydrofolate synthase n=1 Tax=Novosphingobium aerophilum TaxID=2839843 RepID=UPI001639659F|nr:folylpolyglutamate synthase/dihydrofolate synthase family protein [Novosphingobium aerophilum]MBC2662622.1 bifunctional folylpolyglutamate synthase/dihydrofolate synthase [Novosphingobium aerophilum]
MRDFATSDHPGVQTQLNRLAALSLPQGRYGLDTIEAICARLGHPERHLPPVFHVAGTNGKGSTCAFLRAMLEAQGYTVHSATKPHLVRYNERIRIAGRLIDDDALAALLAEVLDASEDLGPSFFEVTTAALFLAFSRHPADACVIEVGLGGRLDATNVIPAPLVCGVASLGLDHEAFLLRPEAGTPDEPIARIAFEKASIAKPGVPLVTQTYPGGANAAVIATAAYHGAPLLMRGRDWGFEPGADGFVLHDADEMVTLPLPTLPGSHQIDNAALAVMMLRHQTALSVSAAAMAQGIRAARWPARLQRLGDGPLTALVPGRQVWLDGGHNPDAGLAIARHFAGGLPIHLIIGMLANKDPAALIAPLDPLLASLSVVPAPGHEAHRPEDFAPHTAQAVRPCADVAAALAALPDDGRDILIAGSLYLAGEVLRRNREFPD